MNGLLIHGADQAAVSLLGRQATSQLGGDVQRVDISACKAEPGQFFDQFTAMSLFGDRQVLLVDDADEACLKFLAPVFAHKSGANFVIVLAGSLGKSSKLRLAAEVSESFAALVVYEEDEGRLRARISKQIAAQNLVWEEDAEESFFEAVGADRAIVASEVEKLTLYAHGKAAITAADVAAVCGDVHEFGADELIDAVLGGDLESTDRIATSLGGDTRSFFAMLQQHILRLQALRLEMEKGMNADMAFRSAKPPIFFKRKAAMVAQLSRLDLSRLSEILDAIQSATLQSRKFADLSEAINSRALLSLARSCRT